MILIGAWLSACTCSPEPTPDTQDTSDPPSTAETSHTADTAPAPPCGWPEIEPNEDLVNPDPLVLEQHACGTFGDVGDLDAYGFTLDAPSWLSVEAETAPGGIGDVFVAIGSDQGWTGSRDDDVDSTDAHLLFLAPAATYTVWLLEQNGDAGPEFAWDLLVSEAKAPVVWNLTESEPNDTQAQADPTVAGDVVYGTLDGNGPLPDEDWFTVSLPPGKSTLTADVDAWLLGSAVNLTAFVLDSGGQHLPLGCVGDECATTGGPGPEGYDRDPLVELDSSAGGAVAIRIVGIADTDEGPASWYTVAIDVESE
jgi:hypothetical protein